MQISDTDLRLLRVFVTIARCGGFTPAQAELNVSQSTISNQMRALETRLGVRLCQRGRQGFRLTEQGRALLHSADELFRSLEQFQVDTAALRGDLTGELRVGVVDGTMTDGDGPVVRVQTREQ